MAEEETILKNTQIFILDKVLNQEVVEKREVVTPLTEIYSGPCQTT